jgi:hypothetical protein
MSTFCVLPCLVSLWPLLFWFLHTNGSPSIKTDIEWHDISVHQLWPTGVGASAPHISVSKAPNQGQLSHSCSRWLLPVLKELKTKHA